MWLLFRQSFINLRRNRVRTFLTSLGIFIGVFSVVVLIAFGVGLRKFVENQFNNLGTNIVVIFPGKVVDKNGNVKRTEGGLGESKFEDVDVRALSRIREAKLVVPAFTHTSLLETDQGKTASTDVFGTSEQQFTLRNLTAAAGSLFTEADVRKKAKVIVLGDKIARELFTTPSRAVGQVVRIETGRFVVKGVTKSKGSGGFGGPDFDAYAYMPYSAGETLNPSGKFIVIYVQAVSSDAIPTLKKDISTTMLRRLQDDDFSLIEQTEVLKTIQGIFGILNGVLVAIGSISLIVGGVGIMNIMYASVNERIKEIGIRRALGATKLDILLQFLSESVAVSLLGGLSALLMAFIISLIASRWLPVSVDWLSVCVALGVSGAVGAIFGVFPARRASNWPPIEAIRH